MSLDVESGVLWRAYSLVKARAQTLGVDPRLLAKLYKGAVRVYGRVESVEYGDGYVRATIASSKARSSPSGPEHTIVVRGLDGRLRKVKTGVPVEESYHHASVSEHTMKCDCPHALNTASRADRRLEGYARRFGVQVPGMLFASHVLCKHTLALLLSGVARGSLPITDRLVDNLTLALIGLAMAEGRVPAQAVRELKRALADLAKPPAGRGPP